MLHPSLITTAVVAAVSLAACGDDNNGVSDRKPVTATTGDAERYCALTRQLDAAGETFFAELGQDASPAEYAAAERRFIVRHAGKLAELERAAPPQIKADVATQLAAMRQRGGLTTPTEVTQSEASAAEKRTRAFEQRSCRS